MALFAFKFNIVPNDVKLEFIIPGPKLVLLITGILFIHKLLAALI